MEVRARSALVRRAQCASDRRRGLERACEEAWDAPDDRTGLSLRTAGKIGAAVLALARKDGES
jgi:hypothetical protein